MQINLKQLYYYVICLITLFVLLWGVIDFASSSVSLIITQQPDQMLELPDNQDQQALPSEAPFDQYYQTKINRDRLVDSLARIIVAGLIFGYSRWQTKKLEEA